MIITKEHALLDHGDELVMQKMTKYLGWMGDHQGCVETVQTLLCLLNSVTETTCNRRAVVRVQKCQLKVGFVIL